MTVIEELLESYLGDHDTQRIVKGYLEDPGIQERAENCMEMIFALREGRLEEAVSSRRKIGNVIELLRPIKAFRDILKECVGNSLLVDGDTPEEIIAIGKEIGGEDMDFSAELMNLFESDIMD